MPNTRGMFILNILSISRKEPGINIEKLIAKVSVHEPYFTKLKSLKIIEEMIAAELLTMDEKGDINVPDKK